MAELLSDTVVWLGGEKMPIALERGSRNKVRIKVYDREWLRQVSADMVAEGDSSSDAWHTELRAPADGGA